MKSSKTANPKSLPSWETVTGKLLGQQRTDLRATAKRGRKRTIASYYAQRGAFDLGVKQVVKDWVPRLGDDKVEAGFLALRRVYEYEEGLELRVEGPTHLKFIREMASALEKLFDKKNCAGWMVRLCGCVKPGGERKRELLGFEELAQRIKKSGGPSFSVDALKKAAQRLRLAGCTGHIKFLDG